MQKTNQFDWLFWSDADAIFTNFGLPIEWLVDEGADLIISEDAKEINAGNFLIRCSRECIAFLNRVFSMTQYTNDPCWEQAAIIDLIKSGRQEIRVKIVAQTAINSTFDNWQPGHLLFHAYGRMIPSEKAQALRDYDGLAKRGESGKAVLVSPSHSPPPAPRRL